MRNIHEIVKVDSSVTCQDGVPAKMDVIAEHDSTASRDDNIWINPNPRAERNFTAVDDNGGAVDQDIFAEPREAEGFQNVARQKFAV